MFKIFAPYMIWIKLAAVGMMLAGWPLYYIEKTNYHAFVQNVKIEQKKQEVEYAHNALEVANAYAGHVDSLQSQLDRLHQRERQGQRHVDTGSVNAGTPAYGTTCTQGFYDKAMRTEQILEDLHALLKKNHVKVVQ